MISEILLFLNNDPNYWFGFLRNIFILGFPLCLMGVAISNITMRYGLLSIIISVLLICGSVYAYNELQDSRSFTIEPGYSFNTSTNQTIASLGDGSLENGITSHGGSFFIGTGHISISGGESVPVYVFYKKLASDEYTQDYIPSKGVIIKTDEEKKPNIEWIYQHVISDKKTYKDNGETVGGTENVTLIKTFIHVPNGTVKINYNLDSAV
jgi:hypothetical protein